MTTPTPNPEPSATPRTDAIENGDWAFRRNAAFEAMTSHARQLETELTAALDRADRCEKVLAKDKERLDWLENTSQRGHFCGTFNGEILTRQAIDAAMKGTQP